MSSQPPQRPRRNASPRAGPQPMRATLPVTLQVRQSSPTRCSNGRRSSPALASSPTQPWATSTSDSHKVKHRRSPDHRHDRTSPERSPSSPAFRVERPKAVRASPIRRTNSLDTIAVPYLSGYWPRSEVVSCTASSTSSSNCHEPHQKDQSTQTEEIERKGSSHKRSSSWGSADNLKEKLRQQLRKQGSRQSSGSTQRASPVHANHSTATTYTAPSGSPAAPLNQPLPRSPAIPVPNNALKAPAPKIRGSVEGLNQEIERLVLQGVRREVDTDKRGIIIQTQEVASDGRRAPPPVLPSVDTGTQTPAENQDDGNLSEENGSRGSDSRSHSVSPTFQLDGSPSRPSRETSPDFHGCKYASSPSHNKSYQLTRDPPDGCERVRSIEEPSRIPLFVEDDHEYCPDKKVSFKLKPSDSSAFCPLPNYPPGEFTKSPQAMVAATQTQSAACGD
ncbi:protein FAM117B-like isoform X2 [Acanthaster planci]|uniref:Protein FAM117B-like isoform X2 n=1 Tax=Acanthaster planci TaxID=133434 RepID=A0A8B7ZRE7_ACAPL|nr:protein FAM117B-like isoform X2 [Acanthaster planci]